MNKTFRKKALRKKVNAWLKKKEEATNISITLMEDNKIAVSYLNIHNAVMIAVLTIDSDDCITIIEQMQLSSI